MTIVEMLPMQPGDVRATAPDVRDFEIAVGFRGRAPVEVGVAKFVAWYTDYYGIGREARAVAGRAPG